MSRDASVDASRAPSREASIRVKLELMKKKVAGTVVAESYVPRARRRVRRY